MDLSTYISEKNAKTKAWVAEDPKNRWAGLLSEDMFHWAEQGITTVEDFKRWELETYIWDTYKDAHGTRPRHIDFKSMSLEELQTFADDISKEAEQALIQQEEDYKVAKQNYEDHIMSMVMQHNVDEPTAIRWDMQAEDFTIANAQDVEHYFWRKGLSYSDINTYMNKYKFI